MLNLYKKNFPRLLRRSSILVAEMTTRRSGAGVGVVDGLLYAVGGHDGPTVRKSAEVFNPQVRFVNSSFRQRFKLYFNR